MAFVTDITDSDLDKFNSLLAAYLVDRRAEAVSLLKLNGVSLPSTSQAVVNTAFLAAMSKSDSFRASVVQALTAYAAGQQGAYHGFDLDEIDLGDLTTSLITAGAAVTSTSITAGAQKSAATALAQQQANLAAIQGQQAATAAAAAAANAASTGLSTGAMVGIGLGVVAFAGIIITIIVIRGRRA